jgi:hypothetical protein
MSNGMTDLYHRKEELWARNGRSYLASQCDSHVIVGLFNMGNMALLPLRRRHAEDFFTRKIRRLQPGLNPRIWVPEAGMLISKPPKPLWLVCYVMTSLISDHKAPVMKKGKKFEPWLNYPESENLK